jgi:hypothetical protein
MFKWLAYGHGKACVQTLIDNCYGLLYNIDTLILSFVLVFREPTLYKEVEIFSLQWSEKDSPSEAFRDEFRTSAS